MKNRKKGLSMPEDIGMTLVFLILIVIMILMGLFVFIKLKFPAFEDGQLTRGQLISYSIDFVSIANRPFVIAEVLSHVQLEDRQLFEQAVESAAAGSLEGASATNLPAALSAFMRPYELRDYSIAIKRDDLEITRVESVELRCGTDRDGWCTYRKWGSNCDVGYVEVDDSGACGLLQVCCKYNKEEYARTVNKYAVVSCGNGIGVCSEGMNIPYKSIPSRGGPICDIGQISLGKLSECKGMNAGKTRLCCVPKTEENEIKTDLKIRAVVPLLYKNLVYGTLEVTAG